MTNEEAIYVIKNTSINLGRRNGKIIYAEALNMAIKALEQPEIILCEDCKHFEPYKNGCQGFCNEEWRVCMNDDFCSWAERRTDG